MADSRVHHHQFDTGNPLAQRNVLIAVIITAVMMVVEIVGGVMLNSMALLADGWHMSSHALALGLAYAAYVAARHFAQDKRFCFGTWKIEILGGFTSAILLLVVAGGMLFYSVERLFNPLVIYYDVAIVIAVIGLVVNLICAWLLKDNHSHHGHDHGHQHAHHHDHSQHDNSHHGHQHHSHGQHDDLNQKAAYLHVLADAATSVLAIIALLAGKYFQLNWLDPVLGIVGSVLVAVWAYGLIKSTARILLDAEMDEPVVDEVREVIAEISTEIQITDLHVWKVGKGKYACILSLLSPSAISADEVRRKLSIHEELVHISVEINSMA